jgi:putative transposase
LNRAEAETSSAGTAVARQRELRPLSEAPHRRRAELEAAARRLKLHPSTVYRLLARYAGGEAVTAGRGGWRRGRPRLPHRTVEIVDAAIDEMYQDRQAPTKAQLGREIARRCGRRPDTAIGGSGRAAPCAGGAPRCGQAQGKG